MADAIARVQKGDLGTGPADALYFINVIADAGAVLALPALEAYYARTSDPEIKAGVASAVVRMGDRKETYWTYLVALATPAVESDASNPWSTAPDLPTEMSTEFRGWASAHNLSPESAYQLAMQDLPHHLAPLAKTGDARGIPLLRKGLSSPNLMIVTLAAAGLAQAQDRASIQLIIGTCKRLPASAAHFVADSLLFFDDPDAARTFAFYFPNVDIPQARKFRGYRPFSRLSNAR